ncbi:energy transducer TonB [Hydrogenobaculum acidophilum]
MTNNLYLDEKKYRIVSFFVAIIFSLFVFFLATLLKVNIYNYRMPKEIKVHLVTNLPLNKPITQKPVEKHVEKKVIKHIVKKVAKHIPVHQIQKPKPVEKPIVSKIPPPEPVPVPKKVINPQEQNITKEPSKPVEEKASPSQVSQKPSPPASSSKPTRDEISLYLTKVYEIIEEHKHYPSLAKRRGDSGSVFVKVRISSSGRVDSVSLLNSSGSYILDEYTKELIKSLKFPPPPKGGITFDLKVNYRLNEGE